MNAFGRSVRRSRRMVVASVSDQLPVEISLSLARGGELLA